MNLDFKLSFLERFGDSDTQDIIAALRREQALADQLGEALSDEWLFVSSESDDRAMKAIKAWKDAREEKG